MKNIKLAEDRRQRILEILEEDGSARVKELSVLFGVSEPTIRADLAYLEEQAQIIRRHGGASLKQETMKTPALEVRNHWNLDNKKKIAKKAIEFISNEDSIILDSGSTISELARSMVTQFDYVQVVTNALNIALFLGQYPEFEVHVIGGQLKLPTLSTTGERDLTFFDSIMVRTLFLATGGVSKQGELTYPSINDIAVKRAMIESAERVVLLADSSKFYKSLFAVLCKIDQTVQYLVTDSGLDPGIRQELENKGIKVLLA